MRIVWMQCVVEYFYTHTQRVFHFFFTVVKLKSETQTQKSLNCKMEEHD